MSLLRKFKNSAYWRPFSRIYQRIGLKARVYSRSIVPPVKTIPQREAFEICGAERGRFVSASEFRPPIPVAAGPMPPEDAEFFASFVAAVSPKDVFEFGTNWGVSSALIALNTPPSSRIRTLDVCREMFSEEALNADPELQMVLKQEHVGWHYRQEAGISGKVTQIFADSLKFDPEAGGTTLHGCDFVLVDACHKYEFVRRDTENAIKLLAPNGVLLWHDFYPDVSSWTDVFRYVSEFAHVRGDVRHVEGTHFAIWRNRLESPAMRVNA